MRLRFITLGAEDEAAVDRAIKLLDLIDRKTLAREKERAERSSGLGTKPIFQATWTSARGSFLSLGRRGRTAQKPTSSNILFVGICLFVPYDNMEEEVARSLGGLNEAMAGYLERKKHEGFSRAELSSLRTTFGFWVALRPGVRKLRRNDANA